MTPRPVRPLLVCMGKTCRSPLAVGVASILLGARVQAESAGITETGRPVTPAAITVRQERFGIDRAAHRSRHLDEVTVAEFDVLSAFDPIVSAPRRAPCPVSPPPRLLWPHKDPSREGLDVSRQDLTPLQATIAAQAPPCLDVCRLVARWCQRPFEPAKLKKATSR